MSITDELREWWVRKFPIMDAKLHKDFTAIADRIDAEHERKVQQAHADGLNEQIDFYDNFIPSNYVLLPVDEGGEPINIGDVMDEQLPFGGYAAPAPVDVMELSRGANGYGWMVRLDAANNALINPKLLRHHHAPTVEDVLREMLDAWGELPSNATNEAIVAEYAAKLRLAEEDA